MAERISVRTHAREELLDITTEVQALVRRSQLQDGVLHLCSLHTTCALTVNEGFDPDVARDVVSFMRRLVPADARFHHAEGNSDSHIKVAMFGPAVTLLIEDGELLLGQWQRIFLCEFDGPRLRTLAARLQG